MVLDGFLNIHKIPGPTSHDVVSAVRRLCKTRQVGHSGTLDPGAEGVLVVAVGRGTRALPFLSDTGKTYWCEFELGAATDTQDAFGAVIDRNSDFAITRCRMMKTMEEFVGSSEQIPPMYSAVKVAGQKLYELARKGLEIERRPRPIRIASLELLGSGEVWGPGDRVTFRVDCTSGTYIRTLCHDIGLRLGTFAHMTRLIRERSAEFKIDDSVFLADLEREPGEIGRRLVSIAAALSNIPEVRVPDGAIIRVIHGNRIPLLEPAPGERVRLVGPGAELLAVAELLVIDGDSLWQPIRVFTSEEEIQHDPHSLPE